MRTATSLGAAFFQAWKVGSKFLQCEQPYEKNSTTSTCPAGASTGARSFSVT